MTDALSNALMNDFMYTLILDKNALVAVPSFGGSRPCGPLVSVVWLIQRHDPTAGRNRVSCVLCDKRICQKSEKVAFWEKAILSPVFWGAQMRKNLIISSLFALSVVAGTASAATVTFSDLEFASVSPTYVENGVTVTAIAPPTWNKPPDWAAWGGMWIPWMSPDGLSISNVGDAGPPGVKFTTGGRFDAVSFDLYSNSFYGAKACKDGFSECVGTTFNNVLVQGYRNDSIVASLLLNAGFDLRPFTVTLGPLFQNLTSLVIKSTFASPDFAALNPLEGWFIDCDAPECGDFDIDNVVLTPVPLPATISMSVLAIGLLGLVAAARRRTRVL